MRKKNILGCIVIVAILIIISFPTVMSNGREIEKVSNSIDINKESTKIRSIDNNKEIITRITAIVWFEDIYWSGDGLFLRLELSDRGYEDISIHIHGFKKPLYPLSESYFNFNVGHLDAPRVFGWSVPYEEFYVMVRGIAFGNIEWS